MFQRLKRFFVLSYEDDDSESSGESGDDEVTTGLKIKSLLKGKRILDDDELESQLESFKMGLLDNDVSLEVADEIVEQVKQELYGEQERIGRSSEEQVRSALTSSVKSVLSEGKSDDFIDIVDNSSKPFVVLFTGVNGVGKTTTIAKFAKMLENEGYSSVLANGDTYRAGAAEQIEEHADNLGKKLIAHEQGGDPTAVLYDAVEYAEANDIDVVLGDVSGRLHTSDDLMGQLEKMERVVGPDMVLFVDEVVAGQDAVRRAKEFDESVDIDGVVLTKADADEGGGVILSLPYVLGKPVYYLGIGQEYSDLEEFNPDEIAELVVE